MLGHLRKRLADESGVTLIELLVTMITAITVMLALFLFQDVVLKQSSATMSYVDATQQARTAINTLESRLHSACIAEGVTPIQKGSTAKQLRFISQYGSATTLTPVLHVITIPSTGTDGALTDATYALASGTVQNPTWATSPTSTVTLSSHVDPSQSSFGYYGYGLAQDSSGNKYMDASGSPYMILLDGTSTLPTGTRTSSGSDVPDGTVPANSPTNFTLPLSSDDAAITAAVTINLDVKPGGSAGANVSSTDTRTAATLTSTVVLRLTPVPTEGNLPSVPPCE